MKPKTRIRTAKSAQSSAETSYEKAKTSSKKNIAEVLTQGLPSRRLALEVLIKIDLEAIFVNAALDQGLKRKELSSRDRAFVTALVLGVVRNKLSLDCKIAALSSRPNKRLPASLLNILRLAIFQLDFMDDIPPSAVLFTSGELAKQVGHIGHSRFANGLLRNFLTSKNQSKQKSLNATEEQIKEDSSLANLDGLGKTYSMPNWIVKRWAGLYGLEETVALLKFYQSTPVVVLRVCQNAVRIDQFKNVLEEAHIGYESGSLVQSCLVMTKEKKGTSLRDIPGYAAGHFAIQDEPSAFVAVVVDPKPNETIIDICAAPGGKTLHLAELLNNTGQVIAVDKADRRLNWLRDNIATFGLTNIQVLVADSTSLTLPTLADKVLLDAPCSGTGVLNRRPDLRYRLRPSDIKQLVDLQRKLLTNAAKLVKPGGILTYSTCSIEPEENIENIKWFLENHKNFQSLDISEFISRPTLDRWLAAETKSDGASTIEEQLKQGVLQLLPSRHDVSGFFIAKLKARIEG